MVVRIRRAYEPAVQYGSRVMLVDRLSFRRRYRDEPEGNPVALTPLLVAAAEGDVTLVYSAHDAEHNQAVVLKEFLDEMITNPGTARR